MAIYAAPTVGRLGILTKEASCNQAALGLIADRNRLSQTFLYYTLLHLRGYFNRISQGAAQQNISKEKVASALFVLPDYQIVLGFNTFVEPLRAELKNLTKRNYILRQTRDLLLPKLISGEVDIAELDIAGLQTE